MRFQFMVSEIGQGLRRNLTMTISVVLVTAVSLLMLGVGLLAQAQVTNMKDYWYDRVQVSIILCGQDSTQRTCTGAATQAQKDAINNDLRSPALKQYVDEITFEDRKMAFEHFKEQFKDSPELLANLSPEQMPESYRVKLNDPQQYKVVSDVFRGRPGVEQVQDQNQVLERLFSLLNGLKYGAWAIAGMTLICSILLVATTIRLTAFTRRRETGIMRLVGASNLVIQLPFILESLIAAALGALLASVMLLGVTHYAVQGWLAPSLKFINNWVTLGDAAWSIPVLFLIGLLIAGVSAFLSLQRYLKI